MVAGRREYASVMKDAVTPSPEGFRPEHVLRCLKEDGPRSVWLVQRPGQAPRTVKTWPLGFVTLAKLILGIAPVQRQIRGQRRLAAASIQSPPPSHRWRVVRRRRKLAIELDLTFVPGRTALELVRDPTALADVSWIRSVAATLGQLVARMTEARLFNRDLKLSNIIVAEQGAPSEPAVWLIDPVGVGPMRRPIRQIERMLERLSVEPVSLSLPLPREAVFNVLLNALRPLPATRRRAVVRRLRARLRRESGQAADADLRSMHSAGTAGRG